MIGDEEQVLCPLTELPEGGARGFLPNAHREDLLFAVRRGDSVHVYLNTCPHNWRPLDWAKDQFLASRGGDIVCFAHGAHFDVASGQCIAGVCQGEYLIAVPARTEAGQVIIPLKLPSQPD
jgi:nitrite reductase/ring-hydroxylating ferredoxin subunit